MYESSTNLLKRIKSKAKFSPKGKHFSKSLQNCLNLKIRNVFTKVPFQILKMFKITKFLVFISL